MYKIGIIGLGYVGLPLATELSKYYRVSAFDIDNIRVNQLKKKIDKNKDISSEDLKKIKNIVYTNNIKELINCNFIIVTVPTPINDRKEPDLSHLVEAC